MAELSGTKVLIVDDEAPIREILKASLEDESCVVEIASNGDEALEKIKSFEPQVTLLDIWMPGSMDGLEVLKTAQKEARSTEFVMMSGHGTIETAVSATKLGAWDFIEKPLSMDKVIIAIKNIINFQEERLEKNALLNKLRKNIAIVGDHPEIVKIKEFTG